MMHTSLSASFNLSQTKNNAKEVITLSVVFDLPLLLFIVLNMFNKKTQQKLTYSSPAVKSNLYMKVYLT